MTSDEKRREVAKRMREYDVAEFRESAIVPFMECLVMECFGHGYVGLRVIIDELADLIDRPTCRICATDHEYEDSVRCDRCRMTFRRPCEPFKYCPNCGAEVVE